MTVLNIQMYPLYLYSGGQEYCLLYYQAVDIYMQPLLSDAVMIGATQDLTTTPYPTFTDGNTALLYYESTYCSNLMSSINSSNPGANYTSYNASLITPAVSNALAMLATVATTGNY